jgi:hypothetical protein
VKKLLIAAAAASVCTMALAGFVDERTAAAQAPVAASAVPASAAPATAPAASDPAASVAPAPAVPAGPVYEVLSTDKTIREVLQRWSVASQWSHEQAHWTLTRDFPVQGTASAAVFGTDFKHAVRTLLTSTESTDLPAQPCFYSNNVVRVVPRAELCDRATAMNQ